MVRVAYSLRGGAGAAEEKVDIRKSRKYLDCIVVLGCYCYLPSILEEPGGLIGVSSEWF